MVKKSKSMPVESPVDVQETLSPPEPVETRPEDPIMIAGESYKPGDTITVEGTTFTVETQKFLKASPKSGLPEGTYPVVWEQQGKRKAYRAIVNGVPYPVRQFGLAGEVISKQRESRTAEKQASSARTQADARREEHLLQLSRSATTLLQDYIELCRGEVDLDEVVSDLVVNHIGPEVERLKATQAAIAKLPGELLARLAHASEDKRREIMELLG